MSFLDKNPFLKAILIAFVVSLLLSTINYIISFFIASQSVSTIMSALIGCFVFVLLIVIFNVRTLKDVISQSYFEELTGIKKVYESMTEAIDDMKTSCQNADSISLLLHFGRASFGPKDPAFFDILNDRLAKNEVKDIRILHISKASKYVSEERANELRRNKADFITDINYIRERIKQLKEKSNRLNLAIHEEPFIWRIFIFDDVMYVSAYLYDSNNDKRARVFKIVEKEKRDSLYLPFLKYFDHLWDIYNNPQSFADENMEKSEEKK